MEDFLMFFSKFGATVVNILPSSPFQNLITRTDFPESMFAWLNWFIPVSDILSVLSVWLVAMSAWTAYKSLLGILHLS